MLVHQAMFCTVLLFVAFLFVHLYYSGAADFTPTVLLKYQVDFAGSRAGCIRECAACRFFPEPVRRCSLSRCIDR